MAVRVTKAMVERNILAQREVDVSRRDLQAFANENAKLMAASSAQIKSESKRRQALQMTCATERKYEERINEEQYERRMQQLTLTQNQLLINELNNEAKDEERKKREIQRVCEESPELRELEKTLKQAYLNQQRDIQYQDKLLQEERERQRVRAIEDQMEFDRISAIEKESGKAELKRQGVLQRKQVLEKQLREKEEQRLKEAQDSVREKEMVDEIVSKIMREDMEEFEERKRVQQENARQMR